MASSLILVANPGSASRKYALFDGLEERARLHFEMTGTEVTCRINKDGVWQSVPTALTDIAGAGAQVLRVLHAQGVLHQDERIARIGLRIVAPGAYFLEHRVITDAEAARLKAVSSQAPLHIQATLHELTALREIFPAATVVGVSDSAFHASKPDYTWNYGIALEDADTYDIKRFGYHGLAVESAVAMLRSTGQLARKVIVCHLGSGASVTAVLNGKSIDNTMGFSPLEGVIMATRSGSIDPAAVAAIKQAKGLTDEQLRNYLFYQSGLLGLGGSADIRELLQRQASGDNRARLALKTYAHALQKAVGAMAAALGGADCLVFTGTVGERAHPIRALVVENLAYLDFAVDNQANTAVTEPLTVVNIGREKPVLVVPVREAQQMAYHVNQW